ncbi:hypothetical protein [Alteraurantiacibacter aquimixticola]|uniref:Uncharacterized protein n=1 Tax=Alteraurantiacibacter aquimixticola TaxID=2489173 RepID=A0A4T3F4W2_9SPHN|nr:hypothetical protein [Alteraurantiacibacter aquimixticola]TIX51509.1 hypothetical protein E5222_03385 [Alteraurantiacibacter aquimixticola]
MMPGREAGWMVPLADLSLILFVLTGTALSGLSGMPEDEYLPATRPRSASGAIETGIASAVHADAPGAPPLSEWLAAYRPMEGEQLTIQGFYAPEDRPAIRERTEQWAAEAHEAGVEARVILQPAESSQVIALFAHDRNMELARSLLEAEHD